MPQKVNPKTIESLIGGIDPAAITDATTHETVERLLNVVEQLVSEVERLIPNSPTNDTNKME